MKKLIVLALLIAGQMAAMAQTVNIYMKDGTTVKYPASDVDYVNFSATGNAVINGHEAVDLGLPSGVKWATCNIGATKPEEAGILVAWGEVEEKEDYSWNTYKWSDNYGPYKQARDGSWDFLLEPGDDAAQLYWGDSWRMPGQAEAKELFSNCEISVVTQNGMTGALLTGPNGNSIFLPAPGHMYNKEMVWQNQHGCYWTSALNSSRPTRAIYFEIACERNSFTIQDATRLCGFSIRAVTN